MSTISTVTDSVTKTLSLISKTSSLAASASSLVSADINSITGSLPSSSSSFASLSSSLKNLSSITSIKNAGTEQALSKVKTLLGTDKKALNQPISFVTKSLTDTIKGFSTTKDLSGTLSDVTTLSKLGSKATAAIASKAGVTSITSDSELNSALTTISSTLSSNQISSSNLVTTSVLSSQSDILGLGSSFSQGINTISSSSSIKGLSTVSEDLLSSSTDGVSSAYKGTDSLFANLTSYNLKTNLSDSNKATLSIFDSDYGTNLTSSTIDNLTSSLSFVSSKLNTISNITSDFNKVITSSSKIYNTYTDTSGKEVTGIKNTSSTLTTSQIKNLYSNMNELDSNVSMPTVVNYSNLKDSYDTTLEIAATNGVSNLISSVDKSSIYYDNRTTEILKSKLATAAKSGDVQTFKSIVSTIGSENVSNMEELLIILNANMSNTSSNVTAYNQLVTSVNLPITTLVSGNTYGKYNSVNTKKVTTMTATNNTIAKVALGTDLTLMALKIASVYGSSS